MNLSDIKLPQGGAPTPALLTAGQPTSIDFEKLAAAGLKHVISLRPASEDAGFDEAALAAKLGLSHTLIPIASVGDLDIDRVRALDQALAATDGEPVLVHCASSNRVGALLALRAAWIEGRDLDEALVWGRSGGLTKMEPAVIQLLQTKPR